MEKTAQSSTEALKSIEPNRPPKSFIVGVTMAGAVSAGAYSAGVLDFLFEALGAWQAAKDRREAGVPMHDVVITTMSGASAGGISGAISLLSLAGGLRPGFAPRTPARSGAGGAIGAKSDDGIRRVLPELYDAWVTGPRLFGDGNPSNGSFLDHSDVGKATKFASLLDSTPLQQVAERVLKSVRPNGAKCQFVSNPVHLFLTVTNLDGIPYVIPFESGGHVMTSHADCVHYAMTNLGEKSFPTRTCQWLDTWGDTGIKIDLSRPLDPTKEGRAFIQTVLATSAFPFALSSRQLVRPASVFRDRAWPIEVVDNVKPAIVPNWPAGTDLSTTYCVAVDGGATDNQPFEYAHWAIRDLRDKRNSRDPRRADRAVIMIDPFGTPKPYDIGPIAKARDGDLILMHVLKTFVPALTNQARFKIEDLVHANDPDTYSRFLIAPSRTIGAVRFEPALASGLLEAFGGFLDQRFREHDFQLGRRNCQWFLQKHFVLHTCNEIFGGNACEELPEQNKLEVRDEDLRPIIPLMPSVADQIPVADWPKIETEKLVDLENAIRARLDVLARKLINDSIALASGNLVARMVWWFRRDEIAKYLSAVVETALLRNRQIVTMIETKGAAAAEATPEQYAVLAALCDPTWDMRTLNGIAEEHQRIAGANAQSIDAAKVDATIKSLGKLVVRWPRGRGRLAGYTLRKRQPRLGSALTRWLSYNGRFKFDDDAKHDPTGKPNEAGRA